MEQSKPATSIGWQNGSNAIRANIIDIKNHNSKTYIQDCFSLAFKIIKKGLSSKLINGPINKTKTLNKKYLGLTTFGGLKIRGKLVKSITVDSIPILDLPPSIINFTFFH